MEIVRVQPVTIGIAEVEYVVNIKINYNSPLYL